MAKPFKALRDALFHEDIDQRYLRDYLKRSQTYITLRINARAPWSLNDIYLLLDLLNIPYDQMHVYFPKGGVSHV